MLKPADRWKRWPKNFCARQALAQNIAWDVLYNHNWERITVMLDRIEAYGIDDPGRRNLGYSVRVFNAPWLADLYEAGPLKDFDATMSAEQFTHEFMRSAEQNFGYFWSGQFQQIGVALGGLISKTWLVPNVHTKIITDRANIPLWHHKNGARHIINTAIQRRIEQSLERDNQQGKKAASA